MVWFIPRSSKIKRQSHRQWLAAGVALTVAFSLIHVAWAAAPLSPPRAARSVHLFYQAPPGRVFYNTVTIVQAQRGSFFQVCGFSQGYFGLQELADGRHVVIFSVWDASRGNNPTVVAQDRRVRVLFHADGISVSRFGGEGTGAHMMWPFPWVCGHTYRLAVTATPLGGRIAYAAYLYISRTGRWKHLVTFSTLIGRSGGLLRGYYAFIEDFRRNTQSAQQVRRALYGRGWVQGRTGHWYELTKAVFTASSSNWEAKQSIDAGVAGSHFYLQTGGHTRQHTKLGAILVMPQLKTAPSPIVKKLTSRQ